MSLFIFLLVVQALVAASLVGVILMQRSEGGGLGVGGSPSGMMSARGAADFLTRATTVLAVLFVILSITLAALAVKAGSGGTVDTSIERKSGSPLDGPVPAQAPAQAPAGGADPLGGAQPPGQPAQGGPADPLAGAAGN